MNEIITPICPSLPGSKLAERLTEQSRVLCISAIPGSMHGRSSSYCKAMGMPFT